MALNVITAKFCSGATQTWTDEAYQWDYGQVLQFDGLELPEAYQVHFSNTPLTGTTITQIGGADGVTVPDQFFLTGETIYAWVYLHEGEDDGETVYMVTIPVKKRPQPSDDVPTPVEQSAIDQAIAALNIAVEKAEDAIEHYPTIIDGTWHVWDVTEEEYVDTGVQAQGQPGADGQDGQDGFSPEVTVTDITGGHRVTITDAEGTQSFDVLDGSGAPAFYGICDSSYGSLTKVVPCDGFELVEGARIIVTFTAAWDTVISSGQMKLNVNGTGAKTIRYRNSSVTFLTGSEHFYGKHTYEFIYDGTYYVVVGDFDTDTTYYQMTQSEADTGTSVTGRLISAKVLHNAIQNAGGSVTVDDELSTTSTNPVQNKVITEELNSTKADLSQLAENGFYTEEATYSYYALSSGQINSNPNAPIEQTVQTSSNTGYVIISKDQTPKDIKFDATKYKANVVFVKNGYQISGTYTGWLTTSPLPYTAPSDWDAIGINVRKLSGNFSSDELSQALYKTDVPVIGNLATKEYTDALKVKGTKVLYPDGFTSRMMPDIYYNGSYYANISEDDYLLMGSGEVWVSLDGNDTTGDGTEANPYLTLTKALTTSSTTIYVKEGTYEQGTHYGANVGLANRNVIGIGNVVFQNDSAGHNFTIAGSAFLKNIVFKHGNASINSTVGVYCDGANQRVCFADCVFRDGGQNGLALTGIDAVCIRCVAHGNALDGFNYHSRTASGVTYIPNVIEIDCEAYNNGSSESGSDSCNGSTAHDGVKIVRVNGNYRSCYGGVIAEIGLTDENAEPTESVNFSVNAHDSTGENEYAASFWASYNTKVYLYDCLSYGSVYDVSAINDAEFYVQGLRHKWGNIAINKSANSKVVSIPDGIDSQFRVIKTITLTADTSRIYVNTDSDGNAFSLKDVVIDFNLTASTGSGVCGIFPNAPDQSAMDGSQIPNLCVNGVFSTSANRRYAHLEVRGGKLFGESTNGSNTNWYSTTPCITSKNACGTVNCQNIKSLTMYSLNNYVFASGSTITIYGR